MPNFRVMAVFQAFTNLPEDRFVNTFHFSDPFNSEIEVMSAVHDFYEGDRPSTKPLADHLSPTILRPYEIKVYNLADPEPRVPEIFAQTLPDRPLQSSTGVPEEVAICVSYHGAPPRTARRRGRIYFGPLGSTGEEVFPASSAAFTRVPDPLITDLIDAAEQLIAAGVGWCVRSTVPAENFVPITGGWVDNRFDTQRRRGPEVSLRTTFGS